jgi:hypothetical protein
LLPELVVTTIKGKGSPKIFYTYDINENFITNLSLYFLKFSKEALITLRRAGLDDLYLYLKNFKETLQEKLKTSTEINRSLNFNHLCKIARIPLQRKDGSEFKNSRDIKQKLIAAFNSINEQTDLQFKVEWVKSAPGTRWKYLPLFFFKDETTELARNVTRRQERMVIFRENLKYELLNYFKQHNDERTEQSMLEWLKSDRNIAEKELAFRTAQYKTFGRIHYNIDKMIKAWRTSLPKINSLQDFLISNTQWSTAYDLHKEMYSM